MLSVRPKIAELVFQLYGRPLHPELFEIHKTRRITREDYEAQIDITSAGHLVTWRHQGLTLTEVATASHHPLPQKRRLMNHRLKGDRTDEVHCHGGVVYQVNFSLERVDPEVFWTYQQEITLDSSTHGILHKFEASGRMALGAISFVNVASRSKSLLIQALHTFPDDYAIVKSQSIFRLPE